MEKMKLDEIKSIQLHILKEVDAICRENNIKYFLTGGTLLGAIRHGGYIPWDDDIDIALLRPEYDKLIEALKKCSDKNSIHILTSDNNPNHIWPFAKVIHEDTIVYELGVELGVNIDIFPIDSLFDDRKKCERFINRINFIRKFINLKLLENVDRKGLFKRIIITSLRKVIKPIPIIYFVKKVEKILSRLRHNDSKYVAAVVGAWGSKEIILRESISETIMHKFENGEYPIPVGYDHILSSLYGDYMQLPPIEKRKSHHLYEAYWKEEIKCSKTKHY